MNPRIFINVRPDPVCQVLGIRMNQFDSRQGVSGLGRDTDGIQIELLAVHSSKPHTGQFRRFMAELKKEYQIITAWFVGNQFLASVLTDYGFKPETMIDGNGDVLTGYRWDYEK